MGITKASNSNAEFYIFLIAYSGLAWQTTTAMLDASMRASTIPRGFWRWMRPGLSR